jgi:sn-glycerol 3-phosphate transport system ATP-binding protein
MLGAERLIYGTLGETLFTVRLDATLAHPKIGDVVGLRADPAHLHWFDAATSARVEARPVATTAAP